MWIYVDLSICVILVFAGIAIYFSGCLSGQKRRKRSFRKKKPISCTIYCIEDLQINKDYWVGGFYQGLLVISPQENDQSIREGDESFLFLPPDYLDFRGHNIGDCLSCIINREGEKIVCLVYCHHKKAIGTYRD